MKIIFAGTPEFAAAALGALIAAGHEIALVLTRPDRPAGRGMKPQASAVKALALGRLLPILQPATLRSGAIQEVLQRAGAEAMVVAAYGLILPGVVLAIPRRGCINIHASLLPRWRGAAPIQRAILAGDAETGVGIMRMEAGLDTGPVLLEGRTPIDRKTAGQLTEELAQIGARLIVEVLADLSAYPEQPQPDDGVTYAKKIDKAETRLDFSQDAAQVERQIRAFAPAPGAWLEYQGERCKVLAADITDGSGAPGEVLDDQLTIACATGAIRPTLVQRAGRPVMATADLLRGWAIAAGTTLA